MGTISALPGSILNHEPDQCMAFLMDVSRELQAPGSITVHPKYPYNLINGSKMSYHGALTHVVIIQAACWLVGYRSQI